MALSIAKSIKSLKGKPSKPTLRSKFSGRRSRTYGKSGIFSKSFVHEYSSVASSGSVVDSGWWMALAAVPIGLAAFWGSNVQSKNNIETMLEDAEEFEKVMESNDYNALSTLARKMVTTARGMSDAELKEQPSLVCQVLAAIVSYQSATGEHHEATQTVELLYSIARRIDAENQHPELLRVVYRADFALQAQSGHIGEAKKLLLTELDLVRKLEKVSSSLEQSDILFALAALSAVDNDPNTVKYLEEFNKLFNGVTAATLSSELENFWRMAIVNQLQYAVTLEAQKHNDTAKFFRNSSKMLYDAFKKISSNKKNIPEWRELEVYAQSAAKKMDEEYRN